MASRVYLTMGRKTVMVALPATYSDLTGQIRMHFPDTASVYSLVVLFQPATVGGPLNWIEVAPSAYAHIHDGAELFVNVAHPLTKEYILPLHGGSVPNRKHHKQLRRTDGQGNRVGVEPGDYDATAQNDEVSKVRPRGVSSGPRGASHSFDNSSLSLELERPGGDAFDGGWGGASERFRRSAKLVPNLKDCKEAVGQTVGQSNFYPEDEEDEIADIKLGKYQGQQQNQGLEATEAGWYAGGEPTQRGQDPGQSEARHLAGGLVQDQHEGKQAPRFHSNDANRNWFAVPNSPQSFTEALPESHRGPEMPITPRWGHQNTAGYARGGYRTPSPGQWLPDQGEYNCPDYVRGRSCSPDDTGTWDQEDRWNDDVADQEFSRTVTGPGHHPEVGHLTNGVLTNGVYTNGGTTHGHLTNGEVSQFSQHQDQHYGASDWSPPRHQSGVQYRPQDLRFRSYPPGGTGPKGFAGSRPRRDPAEISYGSPRPRFQGSNSGWTTIGRKKSTWTDIPLQEESDPELEQPHGDSNNHPWYAQAPPPNSFFHRTTGHGRGSSHGHGSAVGNNTDEFQQKQRPGRQMSWGSDFWGGPPPNRTQRGAFTHDDTPASKHWR